MTSLAVDSVADALPANLDTAVRQMRGVVTEFFSAVDSVRDAVARFDELVEVHAGDRETLVLMLNSMTVGDRGHPLGHESPRKKSFQGNSVIWGAQARVRFATHVVAPNPDDQDLVDSAVVAGLIDLRRLRPNADWPLFRIATVNDDGTPIETAEEPIDPQSSPDMPLMLDYCSKPIPDIREVRLGTHTEYELVPGPIGRTGATKCVIGHCARAFASKYRDAMNEFGEHKSRLVTPVEYQISDLLVHNDLGFAMPPRAQLYSLLTTTVPHPHFGRDRHLLQMSTELQELGTSPPVVATPHIAGYPRLVEKVYEKLGWSAEHFAGYRLVMRYPPIPTLLVLRYDLPDRGAGGRQ